MMLSGGFRRDRWLLFALAFASVGHCAGGGVARLDKGATRADL
jgi:hypothetical protein